MASLKKAVVHSFDSDGYTATISLAGSGKVYLEDVPVARNIPAVAMTVGRNVAAIFFDEHNVKDAVIVAVYT